MIPSDVQKFMDTLFVFFFFFKILSRFCLRIGIGMYSLRSFEGERESKGKV